MSYKRHFSVLSHTSFFTVYSAVIFIEYLQNIHTRTAGVVCMCVSGIIAYSAMEISKQSH